MKTKPAWVSDIEWEVDQIRDQLYEERQSLTKEEQARQYNELKNRMVNEYGFRLVTNVNDIQRAKEEQTNGTR